MLSVSIGTVMWTTIAFLVVLFLLKKLAWKPILASVKEREDFITKSLEDAHKAKEELARLKSKNEDLIKEANAARDELIKEAREAKEKMINEARGKAKEEAEKIMAAAKESIEYEKLAALTELKNQVAVLSIEIAEKIIKQELSSEDKQKGLVNNLLEEVTLN